MELLSLGSRGESLDHELLHSHGRVRPRCRSDAAQPVRRTSSGELERIGHPLSTQLEAAGLGKGLSAILVLGVDSFDQFDELPPMTTSAQDARCSVDLSGIPTLAALGGERSSQLPAQKQGGQVRLQPLFEGSYVQPGEVTRCTSARALLM